LNNRNNFRNFSQSCQQDEDIIKPVTREDCNSENAEHKLRFLEKQYEEKLQEIEKLMDDVKLRDHEIKGLQECITYLLQEKNDLQTKVKVRKFKYVKYVIYTCKFSSLFYHSKIFLN